MLVYDVMFAMRDMPNWSLPTVVYHADWGTLTRNKRWLSVLAAWKQVQAQFPRRSAIIGCFLNRVKGEVGATGAAVVGFDFPIGIPTRYATLLSITKFKPLLLQLGSGNWSHFYEVCSSGEDVSKYRPFYPYKPGGTKQVHLLSAFGATCIDDLRRKCELRHDERKAACPLFWTLGANQVGRAAIVGWRDVIVPALRGDRPPLLWPFDGCLTDLLKPGNIVIVETYPAECYRWFFENGLKGKGKTEVRKQAAPALLNWAQSAKVTLDPELWRSIEEGFPEGDDAFDAAVGLFGMIEVLSGRRKLEEPNEESVSMVEGWIFGQSCAP